MMSMPAHLAEIGYDTVGAALEQRHGLPAAPDADNKPEPSGAGCGDAGDRILEHRGPCGRNAKTPCSFQKMSGASLPRRCRRSRSIPSTLASKHVIRRAARQ